MKIINIFLPSCFFLMGRAVTFYMTTNMLAQDIIFTVLTLNIFYCSKRQKDKTQVKQLRQSSPITYISKYTIEHNDILLHKFIVNVYSK
jgi:mannose/fructose/N-acetylgalactosamine-specific phosphotransferase system component IIC